jgi:aldehyde dehydrogenase (NAD+)
MEELLKKQRDFFQTGITLNVGFRTEMLKKLRAAVNDYEPKILAALHSDLGKSDFESFMCEIGMVRSEITHMLTHMRRYARGRVQPAPLSQFPGRQIRKPMPRGNVLIMSPWNYPFLLTLGPLVDAIAAGNTAIVKPSAYAPATAALVQELLSGCFAPEYVAVVTGGRQENARLLEQKFDLVFFTGSQTVGKQVLRYTAETLTPAILELGGKSPCIVDETAKIPLAAKRIVFGKFLNCGQTCVAPDYILCHESVKEPLLQELKKQIRQQYGQDPLCNPDYGRIINPRHFERLTGLLGSGRAVTGGQVKPDTLQISPTVLDDVTWEDPVMQEEIFGPVLPVLTYGEREQIFEMLADRPKPLALYVFSERRSFIREVTGRCRYGGGCINDCVAHLATSMAFGGVGESGMGAYHGKTGFDAFSHTKSILDKKTWLDLPMRYQPYDRKRYSKLLRLFLK